jgi:hypothetical protein
VKFFNEYLSRNQKNKCRDGYQTDDARMILQTCLQHCFSTYHVTRCDAYLLAEWDHSVLPLGGDQ